MTFEKRDTDKGLIAVVTDLPGRIECAGDFLDVMASSASEALVIDESHLAPEFFNLKSGVLGDVLQKVSNYRHKLVITGDWSAIESGAMRDFIRESNRGGQVVFAADADSGIAALR